MNKILTAILIVSPIPSIANDNLDDILKGMLTCHEFAFDTYLSHKVDNTLLKGSGLTETMSVIDDVITLDGYTLTNNLPHDQDMSFPGFTYSASQEKSTTNSTGWSFNYGLNTSASFNVKFMSGGISHTLGLQYDMSTSDTKTESTTKTWDSPASIVTVPANRIYRIDYRFYKTTVSGYSKIDAELYGDETRRTNRPSPHNPTQEYTRSLNSALEVKELDCKKGFASVSHENYGLGISYSGKAYFNAVQGMKVEVIISDITDGTRNNIVIERRPAVLLTKE
ncbi:hypothetical protein CK910_14030 [Aeromonas sp. CA23]|uniref:ETX/MTX2 family pore-forming toxin n=1 Tax=Aeromonas sp. CA23 TaxID=2033032 RepID=UPI000BFBE548|nr:ETX/MTX2 family pore-forming toxin [Aeromonas sp. CA23]ATL99469.1 hypothetical protein CK910_14030 [Aeromonas sp. CA23]